MIHVLLDTLEGYPFIARRMTLPTQVVYSPQKPRKYLTWLAGAWKVMRKSKPGDTILAVYDFQGVLCYWIGLLTFRRRKILGVNILLKQKQSLRNSIATILYRKALNSRWFTTTATTAEYADAITQRLKLKSPIPVLHDVFYDSYLTDARQIDTADDGYIFSGGRNGRNWPFLFNLAAQMPDRQFKIAIPQATLTRLQADGIQPPPNMECHCDISYQEFNRLMSRASMLALPLDTDAPAALIVIFQAAAFHKPVIVTDTISTRHYIADARGIPLPNDTECWKQAINRLAEHSDTAKSFADNLYRYVTTSCSEASYVATLQQIIQSQQ